jgi:hypothetical protein
MGFAAFAHIVFASGTICSPTSRPRRPAKAITGGAGKRTLRSPDGERQQVDFHR